MVYLLTFIHQVHILCIAGFYFSYIHMLLNVYIYNTYLQYIKHL